MNARSAALLATLDRGMHIIELGPSHNPLARKDDGWNVTVVDHDTREALVAKYAGAPGADVAAIEDVDIIWRGGPLHEAFSASALGTYDALLASHVVEHLPDLAGFLASAEQILRPDTGAISLALPDKRFCFDCLRPVSTTGQVMAAHVVGASRHSTRTAFDECAYAALLDGRLGWGREPSDRVRFFRPLDAALETFRTHREDATAPYVDYHAWQFTPSSFQLIVLELAETGLCDWRVEYIEPQPEVEFFGRLRRGRRTFVSAEARDTERMRLLKGILTATREQIDWMLGAQSAELGSVLRADMALLHKRAEATEARLHATLSEALSALRADSDQADAPQSANKEAGDQALAAATARAEAAEVKNAALASRVAALENSNSWRALAPARSVVSALRGRGA